MRIGVVVVGTAGSEACIEEAGGMVGGTSHTQQASTYAMTTPSFFSPPPISWPATLTVLQQSDHITQAAVESGWQEEGERNRAGLTTGEGMHTGNAPCQVVPHKRNLLMWCGMGSVQFEPRSGTM